MEFTAEQIYSIIQKLTGKIRPVGETNQDEERLKNIETFIAIFDMMHVEIDDISYQYRDRTEDSMRKIGQRCNRHIESMGISD